MMNPNDFIPFEGGLVEEKTTPQFIGHGNTVPDPSEPPDPTKETPSVVPAETNDPSEAVRAVLAGPTRLALPDLKLQPSETPPPEPAEGEEPAQTHPELSLEKDGDKVTRIKVDCICGETIVMDCDY